jgi:hypothetical protein
VLRRYAHPADPVRTFTRLKLDVKQDTVSERALKQAAAKAKKQWLRWNEKRELEAVANRTQDDVEAQLREADAAVDPALRAHCMKETLKEVCARASLRHHTKKTQKQVLRGAKAAQR